MSECFLFLFFPMGLCPLTVFGRRKKGTDKKKVAVKKGTVIKI